MIRALVLYATFVLAGIGAAWGAQCFTQTFVDSYGVLRSCTTCCFNGTCNTMCQ